ncbi:hypothetical protein TrLO_g11879 [Triparma laevis f. longispina]|uniref:TLC domain-containing protein n=1 Tax=Triparma laevis f. longispina TaxID=1714387 RepID=A0A9W7FTG6_9STRA|nr:hypothetical protein TrLO_g11879 [Triparma laevis f. longispina]
MDYLYSMIPHSVMTLVGVEVEATPSADLFLLAAVQETIPKLLSYQLHENLPEWTTIPILSLLLFGFLKQFPGKIATIETYALLHCLLTGPGALLCFYYDLNAKHISGMEEPLRSITCEGPLTPLHTFLPLITLGYASLDLFEGIYNGHKDFIIHGFALTFLFGLCAHLNKQHLIACTLIMEVSTIPLQFLKAKFSETIMLIVNLSFLLSFVGCRLVIVPYLWFNWLQTYYSISSSCYPPYFVYMVWVFGITFHGLNVFWAWKIFKKVLRKAGGEKMGDNEKLD